MEEKKEKEVNVVDQLLDELLTVEAHRRQVVEGAFGTGAGGRAVSPAVVERATNTSALLLAMGQSEQACLILEEILRGDQGAVSSELLNNLAFAHLVGGRLARAIELWEQAASLAPEDELIAGNLKKARARLNGDR